MHDGAAASARSGDARPNDDAGHTSTALEHRGLPAPQRRVAGGRGAIDSVIHVAAVVGGENDDGVVGKLEPVEGVEQRANGVIHAFDHGGIGGTALRIRRIHAGAILLNERLFGIEWSVYAEHPVVQIKRLILVSFHECHGFLCHAVLEVLVGLTGVGVKVLKLPWCDKTSCGSWARPVWHINIETLLQRRIRFLPEMPLAEMSRGIARGFQ